MSKNSAITILRWGLAFVFFYAAIAGLVEPLNWVGYFPHFLLAFVSPKLLLSVFSVYEIILAVFLFIGRKLIWASLLSAVTLAAITILNLSLLDLVFRDVGLAMAALALYELVRAKNNKTEEVD